VNRRLYRCRHNKLLAGVAAGVAEFFDLDPTLVRVLWFVSIFFGGIGLLLYIGMALIVPLEPLSPDATEETVAVAEGHRHAPRGDGHWTTLFGGVLILFGILALVDRYLPAWGLEHFVVPAFAIGVGAYLVARSVRRESMET